MKTDIGMFVVIILLLLCGLGCDESGTVTETSDQTTATNLNGWTRIGDVVSSK